jgi:signal transduction histidine kinase
LPQHILAVMLFDRPRRRGRRGGLFPIMSLQTPQQSRIERLIAITRVVMASTALLAVWLDPSQPARYAQTAYVSLTCYLVYALALALLAWQAVVFLGRLKFITHVLDLVFFALLIYLTEGSTSPFYVYFVFSLVCATLRWRWPGTFWTALVALTMFVGMGVYAATVWRDPAFALNRIIVRAVYLAVAAALLAYLAAHKRRVDSHMSKLAAWPRGTFREIAALAQNELAHAADLLHAPRAVMLWEEPEEPWIHLAVWSHNECHLSREPPDMFDRPVAEPLIDASFFSPDVRVPVPRVLYTSSGGLHSWDGAPLHPNVQTRFAIGSVLSSRLRGATFEGRLFFLDMRRFTPDELVVSDIVAHQVVADMDQFYLSRRLQQAAVTEERLRLARNLHDGLLQSLTGMSLQMAAVRRLLEENLHAARDHLLEIQRLIADEQRDLRFLVRELKSATLDTAKTDFSLATRLEAVSKQIERQWGLRVELDVKLSGPQLPTELAHEIYYIVHEALVNAARHACASAVCATIEQQSDRVQIAVADNGRGFPFQGRYTLAALMSLQLGPAMLRDRVASLGGTLALDSTAAGSRLAICLPLASLGGYPAHPLSARR